MTNPLSSPSHSVAAPTPETEIKPRATGIFLGLGVLVGIGTLGMIVFTKNLQIRPASMQTIAPGLTLTKALLNTPDGKIPEYIVRADTQKGWKLRLIAADDAVLTRRPVSDIAARWNAKNGDAAPIAINGGYFAYDGAAVGAVKINGEWLRLPWKSRTAIGWSEGSRPQIASVSATAQVEGDGFSIPVANLNGRATTTTCALLTRHFAPAYTLQKGEVALLIRDDHIQAVLSGDKGILALQPTAATPRTPFDKITDGHKVLLAPSDKLLVAGAQSPFATKIAALSAGATARFKVQTSPVAWNDFSTILGGGPRLIQDGQIKITHVEEEFRPDVLARGPRTTIGIDQKGNLTILVIEAWHDKIKGMTLESVAAEMQGAGGSIGVPIVDAINLDGGSSTTLWVKGHSLTHQSDLVIESKIIEHASDRREVGVANAVLLEKSAK